ncbi:serine protease Do [Plasticicumulans lactativorans]|uniref:Probable periplasmic serine endoprotease DegP-like n=1 Tax=Plasticicumulans lactativorans TaxID=1133106 RepID=A0A4R2L3X5_9GAMM|nr:trypsin-like peptidase domain-containing protein [Plasticicumulans lactativorans]TCO80432.1 serine protease Do [Plasticicumulans lactativorans]
MAYRGGCAAFALLAAFAFDAFGAPPPDFTDVVKRSTSVVVNISSTGKAGRLASDAASGDDEEDEERIDEGSDSLGTGIIIAADGYLLTNQHVVENADEIIVRLADRRELPARVVGSDARTDLAVLKVEAQGLPTAALGQSDALDVGEWVLAIGSPFGFEQSVTAGIVSAKGRSLPTEPYVAYIQTDVPINPGNSGGPLINMKGEVVGINSQIFSQTGGYMGLSFAIPIETAVDVAQQIRAHGKVSRGWVGVLVQPVNRDLAESFGLDAPRGALVSKVFDGGPAAAAGVRPGDIVTSFDGRPIVVSSALPPLVGQLSPGRQVPLVLLRGGREERLSVHIAELPEGDPLAAATPHPDVPERAANRLGLRLGPVPPDLARLLGLGSGGALVEAVDNDRATRAGLRQGDVLSMLNGNPLEGPEAFDRAVEGLPTGRALALLVLRRSGPAYLALRIP